MAGLPKKFAKMGFKRGWRAYKASRHGGRKMSGMVDYPLMGKAKGKRRPKHSGSSKSVRGPYRQPWKMARPYDASSWMSKHHPLHGAGGIFRSTTHLVMDGLLLAGGVIIGRALTSLIMNKIPAIPKIAAPVLPVAFGVAAGMQRNRYVRMLGLGSATGAIVKLGDRYVTPMLPAALQGEGEITAQDIESALVAGEIQSDEAALLLGEYDLAPTPALLGVVTSYQGEITTPGMAAEDEMYGEVTEAGGY
jgi:hypothetical protein